RRAPAREWPCWRGRYEGRRTRALPWRQRLSCDGACLLYRMVAVEPLLSLPRERPGVDPVHRRSAMTVHRPSPLKTADRFPLSWIEKTTIGILFSRESEMADASITFKSRDNTS